LFSPAGRIQSEWQSRQKAELEMFANGEESANEKTDKWLSSRTELFAREIRPSNAIRWWIVPFA
jgi:hypothetical protein